MALDEELLQLARTNPVGVQYALASRRPQFAQFKGDGRSRVATPQAPLSAPSLISAPKGGSGGLGSALVNSLVGEVAGGLGDIASTGVGMLLGNLLGGEEEAAAPAYRPMPSYGSADQMQPPQTLPASDMSPQDNSQVPPPPDDAEASAGNLYAYARSKGASHNHAVALAANAKGESSFNSNAVGDNGNSFGLFQWNGPRREALFQHYDDKAPTWKQQVDYIMDGVEPESREFLEKGFDSPEQATEWFVRKWERPKNVDEDVRKRTSFIPAIRKEVGTTSTPSLPIKYPASGTIPNLEYPPSLLAQLDNEPPKSAFEQFSDYAKNRLIYGRDYAKSKLLEPELRKQRQEQLITEYEMGLANARLKAREPTANIKEFEYLARMVGPEKAMELAFGPGQVINVGGKPTTQSYDVGDKRVTDFYNPAGEKIDTVTAPRWQETPSEGERKTRSFAERMGSAEAQLGEITGAPQTGSTGESWIDYLISQGGGWTNFMRSAPGRQYSQAADEWILAFLRRESGASITSEDRNEVYRTYFPLPGDDKATIAQKAASRRQAMESMASETGRAGEPKISGARSSPADKEPSAQGGGPSNTGIKAYVYDPSTDTLTPRD